MNGATSSEQLRYKPCSLHGVRLSDCAVCAQSLPENSHECSFGSCQKWATVQRTYRRTSNGSICEVRRYCAGCVPLASQMDSGLRDTFTHSDEPLLMCLHATYSTEARRMVRCGSDRFSFSCRRGKNKLDPGYVAVRTCLRCGTKASEDVAPDVHRKVKTDADWRAWWLKIESRDV